MVHTYTKEEKIAIFNHYRLSKFVLFDVRLSPVWNSNGQCQWKLVILTKVGVHITFRSAFEPIKMNITILLAEYFWNNSSKNVYIENFIESDKRILTK